MCECARLRVSVLQLRAYVFLLIVYIFPALKSFQSCQFTVQSLADRVHPLSVSSPPSSLGELIYRALDVGARSDLPPCQRIWPFRNSEEDKSCQCPHKAQELRGGLFLTEGSWRGKRGVILLNHNKKNTTGWAIFTIFSIST